MTQAIVGIHIFHTYAADLPLMTSWMFEPHRDTEAAKKAEQLVQVQQSSRSQEVFGV